MWGSLNVVISTCTCITFFGARLLLVSSLVWMSLFQLFLLACMSGFLAVKAAFEPFVHVVCSCHVVFKLALFFTQSCLLLCLVINGYYTALEQACQFVVIVNMVFPHVWSSFVFHSSGYFYLLFKSSSWNFQTSALSCKLSPRSTQDNMMVHSKLLQLTPSTTR